MHPELQVKSAGRLCSKFPPLVPVSRRLYPPSCVGRNTRKESPGATTICCLSVLADVFVFILPIPTLLQLNMPMSKRLQLVALFGTALPWLTILRVARGNQAGPPYPGEYLGRFISLHCWCVNQGLSGTVSNVTIC